MTLAVILAGFWLAVPAAVAGERIALVIGNGAYLNTSPLPNPPSDAGLMARTLQEAGFAVTTLIDADQATMKRALLDFGRSLRGPDIEAGLFFYAGHGVQVAGQNYLVPVNASITSEDEIDLEGINVNDFLRVMNSSNSEINIVILDACRNNPFARSFRAVSRGLAPVDAPKGTLIAYATAPGDVALDGRGNNSPYTLALSEAISTGGGETIESVFKTTRRNVLEATGDQQVPWETSSVTGDFFFHGDRGGAQVTPPPAQPAPVVADPEAEMARKFEMARQIGTQAAWEAFLGEYGSQEGNFYVALAREALEKTKAPATVHRSPPGGIAACYGPYGGLAGAELCVSSILDPQYGNRYGGSNLTDGDMSTAWVEGVAGDGEGQSIVLKFGGEREPSILRFANGYNKTNALFEKNGRVREIVIAGSNGRQLTAALRDTGQWQAVDISALGPVTWLSLTIRSAYRGSAYRDTAISELRVE